ncbi:MAG: hypothetical protein RL701_5219 [Pseudomonadota bacterium]|jgi:hypothetical protein
MAPLAQLLKHNIETWSAELQRTSALGHLARRGELSPRGFAVYIESVRYLLEQSELNLTNARERARALQDKALTRHLERKSSEERDHASWAVDDLTKVPAEARSSVRPAKHMLALIELQKRLIDIHPICFMAYALWAEYFTVLISDYWLDALALSGYGAGHVTAISKHVERDRDHAALALQEIDDIWDGTPDLVTIVEGVAEASRIWEQFCDEVCETASQAA